MRSIEVARMLNDGSKLLDYAKRTIDSKLWRKFETVCLMQSMIRIEALYESIGMLPDYLEWIVSMKKKGKTYTLADHLRRCISKWIYYQGLRNKHPEWEPKRQVVLYWTKTGSIKATYMEKIYPHCNRCARELCLDLDGYLRCSGCGCDGY